MHLPPLLSRARRRLLARLIAWGIAQAIGAIATVVLVKAFFDSAVAGVGGPATVTVALLAGVAVATYLARVAERTDAEHLGQRYVASCRLWMFDRLSGPDARTLSPRLRGLMMARFVSDLSAVRLWVSRGIARLVTGSFAMAGALVGMAIIDPRLALAAMLPFVLVAAGLLPARRTLLGRIREMRRRRGRVSAHVGDVMEQIRSSAKPIDEEAVGDDTLADKTLAKERRRLRNRSRRLTDAATHRATASEAVRGSARLAAGLATAALLAMAARLPAVSAGDVAAILSVLGFLAQSGSDLVQALDYRLNYRIARMKLTQSFVPRSADRAAAGHAAAEARAGGRAQEAGAAM